VLVNGIVPPPNIGPRSIEGAAGLGAGSYEDLITAAIMTASTGETVYCGPADDPFFVDLGGIFDLGDAPRQNNGGVVRDGLGPHQRAQHLHQGPDFHVAEGRPYRGSGAATTSWTPIS
jgi:hypothetical protein